MESVKPTKIHATIPVKAVQALRDLAALKRKWEWIKAKLQPYL